MSQIAPQACKYTWGQGLHSTLLWSAGVGGVLYGHSRVAKYRNAQIDEIAEKDSRLHSLEKEVEELRLRVPAKAVTEAVAPLNEVESDEFNWDTPVESLLRALEDICTSKS